MKINVMAGGGLSSWYVIAKLADEGYDVHVWLAEVEQKDEMFKDLFIQSLHNNSITVDIEDKIDGLSDLGLEIARFQGRYPNGYWNTTSLLRCYLVAAACNHFPSDIELTMAHGCVGYGNDQRRFTTLFDTLNNRITVKTALANWFDEGSTPSRHDMVRYVENWANLPKDSLAEKIIWSSDGSILGVSHEGTSVEDISTDWTKSPFVMTKDPLQDVETEIIDIEIKDGNIVRVGEVQASNYDLLQEANRVAGNHGIGRIGVMENKLRGTKCRGIYEAPGLTLLGYVYRQFYDFMLDSNALERLNNLSDKYAKAIYSGEYYTADSISTRNELAQLTQSISGIATVALRGGHFFVKSIINNTSTVNLEQRFSNGGVAWVV